MLEHILWNTAIVATTVAWIRFCDWKLKPWLRSRPRITYITKGSRPCAVVEVVVDADRSFHTSVPLVGARHHDKANIASAVKRVQDRAAKSTAANA